MPPKQPGSVDGINRSSSPSAPAAPVASSAPAPGIKLEPPESEQPTPQKPASNAPPDSRLMDALKSTEATPSSTPKNEVKTSKQKRGPTIVILITLIVMVLLIGLAYYAYHKSQTG